MMKTVGIICEYNPFHNGHLYQIESIRKRFGTDCAVIAIMSGNFVQRGEAAMLDKWSRTRAALLCGVNLVIELPAVYATGSAERFADGGVALAAATGLCDYLVFGSETGELEPLAQLAGLLATEPEEYKNRLKEYLDQGFSFPASRSKALQAIDPSLQAETLLSASNNILAIEYLKAMKRRNIRRMKPCVIKREGQGYRETAPGSAVPGEFRSAGSIRVQTAVEKNTASLLLHLTGTMPEPALAILANRFMQKKGLFSQEKLADSVFSALRSLPLETLSRISGMNEGLDARLKEFATKTTDPESPLSALVKGAASKRFPETRVQRALTHLLLGIRNEDLALFDQGIGPLYLRVLGLDKKGRYLLKKMKTYATLPILMKGSDFLEYANTKENEALRRMAEIDCIGTDLWMLKINESCGCDYTVPPVMLFKTPVESEDQSGKGIEKESRQE